MGLFTKDNGIFQRIIQSDRIPPNLATKLYEEVLRNTPFIFNGNDQNTHDLYCAREDTTVIYQDSLARNIFENPEIFAQFQQTIQNQIRDRRPRKINAFDYASQTYKTFDVAGIVTTAIDIYSGTKDKAIIERIRTAFSALNGRNHPIIQMINQGRLSPQLVGSFSLKQVQMLLQSLGSLDDYVVDPNIKNKTISNIFDVADGIRERNKEYFINGNLDTMMGTHSQVGSQFTLSRALHDEVLKGMPKEIDGHPITEMEIATYIYTRLCQVLRYDPLYLYNSDLGKKQHSSPLKLSSIYPDTPILCYEFAYLYSKFLEEFNIEHAIVYGNQGVRQGDLINGTLETEHKRRMEQGDRAGYYSNGHTFCIVRAMHTDGKKHTFIADSTRTATQWDIDSFKTSVIDPRSYTGLTPLDTGGNQVREACIMNQVKTNVAHVISQERNEVRLDNIVQAYNAISGGQRTRDLSMIKKMQMIRQILSKSRWGDNPEYFRKMKDILSQFGVDFEFVIGRVQDYYEVNVLVGYEYNGQRVYDYAYPPGEFETLTREQVIEKYKSGEITSKPDRMQRSTLLQTVFGNPANRQVSKDLPTREQ